MNNICRDIGVEGSHDLPTRYIRKSKAISGRLHDELVMMDIEQGKYFSLNPVATRIWELLADSHDIDELCSLLTGEYEVEPDQCLQDVSEYIVEMLKFGLILKSK